MSSLTGQHYSTLSFSVGADSTRTVVVSGSTDTATVAVTTDTTTTSAPLPTTGRILLVNSAPGVGPVRRLCLSREQRQHASLRRILVRRAGTGTTQSTSPYRYMFPFNPGTYTFAVTNPGSTTALVSTTLTLATNDQWTVVLTTTAGTLALAATKQ